MNIQQEIVDIVKNITGLEEVSPNQKLIDGIGIDSFSYIQLIIELEEKFHMKFNDQDLNIERFPDIESLSKYFIDSLEKTT
ncbi:acyl carrier protein [Croceifilum oryzae]|uniref:Acyl carrier protein n=1 Tax=Croceifilum oryzae TaxID=1553429 RepID=A0AAJ1TL28_9BACL|nr:acyl carrier protein [Croceifilum oryzae]MDQ0417966.1 acyl carrier protein [Croceifilum oryzae]